MDDFFDKAKRLTHKQSKEIAVFCGSAALLLLVAGFVAAGGTARIGQSVALNGISPSTLTANIFDCLFSSCGGGDVQHIYTLSANTYTSTPGAPVTLGWEAYSQIGNGADACINGAAPCSILTAPWTTQQCIDIPANPDAIPPIDTFTGNCTGNISNSAYAPSGTYVVNPAVTTTYYFCSDGMFSLGLTTCPHVTITVICPAGYTGTPPNCTLPPPPPPPPTCANGLTYATYGPSCTCPVNQTPSGNTCVPLTCPAGYTGTYPNCVAPVVSVATILSSFTANPASVITGNNSTLTWLGTKGTDFSACELAGGQWGAGVWFTALPGSIATNALTANTTYSMDCFDTTGASTGWKSATVTVTAAPTCANGLSYATYGPSCTCPVNQTPSGGLCVPLTCSAGTSGTYPNCVANPLCANGLNDSYAPSCTCPAGQYQPPGGSTCVALPVCANGLNSSYSPSCTCPSGEVQVLGGSSCVPEGVINSLTATPSRVLKGNTATVSWDTLHMDGGCTLSAFSIAGTVTLSTKLSFSINPVINSKTIFTLSCIDAAGTPTAESVTVGLIPQTIEQ